MPTLDPNRLTRNELVQLVNSTPLGTVLTRARLDRQMNQAGRRWHDGRHIRLLDYVRWLAEEADRPPEPTVDSRAADLARKNAATLRAQDIAPIPEVEDRRRRAKACTDFRLFCETYFPAAFDRAWSDDHLRVIAKIEEAVLRGGLFAFAMPRGSGKTLLARTAGLWAILIGARRYVCLIGGSQDRAADLLGNIKRAILGNPLLGSDFPEVVYPFRMLRNNARKQIGQHVDGELTHITWGADKLVFPTVNGSKASGSIITTTGLDSNMRGQQHETMDGQILRPSLVILDDPQTRQSARSPSQTKYRLQLLNGDVLGMAGPGEKIAAFMACTKIYHDDLADQILDRKKNPEWQGECTRMVYSFPTAEKLWDRYAQLRADGLRTGDRGKEATEFYQQNREAMDAGARVAWPARYNDDELSAVQHAMNLRLRDEEAFLAEYQNEPAAEQAVEETLTADEVAEKVNGRKRGEIPLGCGHVTAFIDVHDKLLFYAVAAWEDDFTGYIVDYGTFPEQKRAYFTARNATRTLGRRFPKAGKEGAIAAGLKGLLDLLLSREWVREDGSVLHVGRCLIDAGYEPDLVHSTIRRSASAAIIMPSLGQGITAANKPISEYSRKRGDRIGHYWWVPSARRRRLLRTVHLDTNYWKTFVHTRLAVMPGDKGCLSLFGSKPSEHRLFADHVTAEYRVRTEGRGRKVDEWKLPPSKADNHWLDCLVGCAVAASMLGVSVMEPAAPNGKRIKRRRAAVTYL
jgi:hypothetical protein